MDPLDGAPPSVALATIHDQNIVSSYHCKGGRPKGATKILSKGKKSSFVVARNEIVAQFVKEKRQAKSVKQQLKRGRLEEIVEQTKKRLKLPDNFTASKSLVCWRELNACNFVVSRINGSGQQSPLLEVEPQFISIVIQMACIGDFLTPMKALALFNDMISGTPIQQKLKKFKLKHTQVKDDQKLGEVGYKYWRNFKARHSDKIVTRKGEKYKLNRST